jgi:predicted permease
MAVTIVSLACGIGLNTAVFSIINTIFLQGIRGVPAPERIVTVAERVPFAAYREVRDASLTLDQVAVWQPVGVDLRFRDTVLRDVVPAVSGNYFTSLGVRPFEGRLFESTASRTPADTPEVVLDYEFWMQTTSGDPGVLGEQVVVNRVPATIVGIAPRSFHGFGPERPPLWIHLGMLPGVRGTPARWDDPEESGWRMFGRLAAGASLGQVNAEIQTLASRSPALFPAGLRAESAGGERWSGPVSAEKRIEFLLVVVAPLVVVGLVLWIGCSNVANLLLARASARRKEIAIRLANGATRSRLIRLLLTESLLLALAGGAAGMLLAAWTLDLLWLMLPDVPRLAVEIDARVLLYTSGVCVLATILFGLAPALQATRLDVAPLLKGEAAARQAEPRGGTGVRRFFLVTQFASSMALLVIAGTFVRAIVVSHLGPQSAFIDHLAVAYVEANQPSDALRAAHWRAVRQNVRRVPGVSSVTLTDPAVARAVVGPAGAAAAGHAEASIQGIDQEFIAASGITVIAGTGDVSALRRSPLEQVLINGRAARQLWGGNDALGRRFSIGAAGTTPTLEVAGIVRDDGLESRVFRALRDEGLTAANVLVRTSPPSGQVVGPLRSVLSHMGGEPAFVRVATLREASTGPLARITWLAMAIAAVVLSLAAVGLYGAISFVTSQRTKEIANPMAVGAPAPAVLRLVLREGVLVVAAGSVLGLAAMAFAFRFMSGMIFASWRLVPATIAGVLAVFSGATLAACYVPARRASRLDPMTVLRSD